MKEIGGFFELELNRGREYHSAASGLNLGRTAFEYILKARNVKKIHLPYYICDVILESAARAGTAVEFYHVDERLEPVYDSELPGRLEWFLYINYFGIKDRVIKEMALTNPNLIIDNSQAFFSMPVPGIDTFYSARKFFGVPDGGYLYTGASFDGLLETDNSSGRFAHLIGRIENGAEESYPDFKESERLFQNEPIKRMSTITTRLLQNINYDFAREKRRRNFEILNQVLGSKNLLLIETDTGQVPMVYPFWTDREGLNRLLIERQIYTATYWPGVLSIVNPDSVEHNLVKNLVPLPVDQRLGDEEMRHIANTVLQHV